MLRLKKKIGQSTVEYLLLFTAVVAILIAFLISPSSPFHQRVNQTLTEGTDGMVDMANRLRTSRPADNSVIAP